MKIAVVGLGRIGPLHAGTLLRLPGVSEVLLADVVPGRAETVAAELGARALSSVDEAFAAADAVVITAPTDTHPELIRTAIGYGKPTLCEKPLAPDLAGSIVLRDEIEASGLTFQLGFQRRFDPAYVEAKRLIDSGDLGRIYMINLQSHDPEPASAAYIASSGGMFRDLSIHDLDMLRFLTGAEVTEVTAMGEVREFPVYGKYADHETAVGTLRMDNGVLALLGGTRHDPLGHDVRTEIFGSGDSVSVGLGPRTPLRSLEPGVPPPAGPAWRMFLDRWDAGYHDELAAFIAVAAGDTPSPGTARDGVAAQRIAEALSLAVAEHRIVELSEIAG